MNDFTPQENATLIGTLMNIPVEELGPFIFVIAENKKPEWHLEMMRITKNSVTVNADDPCTHLYGMEMLTQAMSMLTLQCHAHINHEHPTGERHVEEWREDGEG